MQDKPFIGKKYFSGDGAIVSFNLTAACVCGKSVNLTLTATSQNYYYAYAEFAESENMEAKTTEPVAFTVLHSHGITFSTNSTNNEIIASCATGTDFNVKATLKTTDVSFSGEPYNGCTVENQEEFENKTGRKIKLDFYNGSTKLNEAPTNAGTYKVEMSIDDTNKVSKSFTISKKTVTAPTATSWSYIYNGKSQTFKMENTGDSSAYTVTGDVQTNAGNHTVTVALKDTANTMWADNNSSENKTFTFTIARMMVPKPKGDPRIHTYTGGEQEYLVYSVIGKNAYNLMDVFYQCVDGTSNKQKDVNTYNVKVAPMSNFKWEDNTTAPLSFTYTIKQKQMSAGVVK